MAPYSRMCFFVPKKKYDTVLPPHPTREGRHCAYGFHPAASEAHMSYRPARRYTFGRIREVAASSVSFVRYTFQFLNRELCSFCVFGRGLSAYANSSLAFTAS